MTRNFTVKRKVNYSWPNGWMNGEPIKTITDDWTVSLPHSCDEWCITEDDQKGVSHELAVEMLEKFISDAQVALVNLKNRQECGDVD